MKPEISISFSSNTALKVDPSNASTPRSCTEPAELTGAKPEKRPGAGLVQSESWPPVAAEKVAVKSCWSVPRPKTPTLPPLRATAPSMEKWLDAAVPDAVWADPVGDQPLARLPL